MTTAKRFVRLALSVSAATMLIGVVSTALADPIGYVQTKGRISVQPDGANAPVRINGNYYTVFANDRIDTTQGSAVLMLNGGGVIGLSEGTSASIQNSGLGDRVGVTLERGALTYSVPTDTGNFNINVDGVVFDTSADTGEVAGNLSVDENRQVNAFARAGEIRVLRSNGRAIANAGVMTPTPTPASSGTGSDRANTAQAFDTLVNVPQGNAVQMQTADETGVAAVSLMSGAASPINGEMVIGGEEDEGIQSVSP